MPGAGTAIGDALARSVQVARAGKPAGPEAVTVPKRRPAASPLAIVLLSDGSQTRGYLTPLQGAERAKAAGIPVYTVALGTARGVVTFRNGPFSQTFPVPPDPDTLRQIAATTGGTFYSAGSAARLNAVYEKLGSSIGRVRKRREETAAALGVAAVLLVAASALAARWGQRLP
jgi:Ca-activated chloride channel family protein